MSTPEGESAPQRLPLFYKNPEPLNVKKHSNMGLKKNFGLGFTRHVNAVPINVIEMPQVCHSCPIAFSADETASPFALLGLRENENLYLDENDEWLPGAYVPAYIRRYPFIFSEIKESDQLTLCLDLNADIVGESFDQKFFDDKGEATQLTQQALEFCKSYHAANAQTREFCAALAESGLLVDRGAEIRISEQQTVKFTGFRIIDEQKLKEMSDQDLLKWRDKGWLPFVYAQMFSGAHWQRLSELLRLKIADENQD